MASPQGYEKLFANAKMEMWDHDPGSTAAMVISPDGGTTLRWVDLEGYEGFAGMAMSSTLTGAGITKMEIVAADDNAGTNTVVIKDSGTVAADAVGDFVVLECSAAEVRQESNDNSYTSKFVGVRLTVANNADEAVCWYGRVFPKYPASGLTATTIS